MENNTHQIESTEGKFGNIEFNRFGIMSAVLLIVGCMGGFAVGLGGVEHIWSLTLIVIPTMTTLSLMISVSPMKLIIASSIIATVIDTAFILFYLLT